MQTVKAYFEERIITAQVVGFNDVGYNEERVVYSNPIKLFSGVNNSIKVRCLNSDQKRIDVSNVAITVGLFESNTENELIVHTGTNIDSANGIVDVNFTASDLAPLDFGTYQIAVSVSDNTGNSWPIYIDSNYGSRLQTTLCKGPIFAYADPTPITFIDHGNIGVLSSQIDLTSRPTNSTTATLQIEFIQPYTGNIVAQGSLVTAPNTNDFANINSVSYSNANGIVIQNVLGSYAVIQFLVDGIDPNGWGNIAPSSFINNANIRS